MALSARLTVQAGRVLRRMDTLALRVPKAVQESLLIEARAIYDASQRVVPEETPASPHYRGTGGDLKASGQIDSSTPGRVVVSYGSSGPSQAYAIAVHEHLSAHSPYTWKVAESRKAVRDRRRRPNAKAGVHFYKPGSGPKYLESPFKKRMSGYQNRISMHIRARLMR